MFKEEIDYAELEKTLADFEAFRKVQARKYKIYQTTRKFYTWTFPLALICVFLCFIPFLTPILLVPALIGIAIFIFDLVLYNFILKKPNDKFYDRFKQELFPKAVKCLDPSLEADYKGKFSDEEIKRSLIFQDSIYNSYGEDMIKGSVGNIDLRFCEMNLSTEKFSPGLLLGSFFVSLIAIFFGEGDIETHKEVRLFKGLFFCADFHKSFKGSIILCPKKAGSFSVYTKKYHKGRKKVEMGNVAFDNYYNVYATDPQMASYVLTPLLMEQFMILDEQSTSNEPVVATFHNGKMYLGVPQEKDFFECDIYKGIPDVETFKAFVNEVSIIEKILVHLDQNVRIWGDKAVA
ncbi:MAG: DUF3137 domain-containing protein [Flavobacteriales bacterium]